MSRISERVKPFVVDEADAPLDGWDDPVKGRIRWRTLFSKGGTPTDGITCGVCDLGPGDWLGLHRHAPLEIYYVWAGAGVVTLAGNEVAVKAGSAVFIPGWRSMASGRRKRASAVLLRLPGRFARHGRVPFLGNLEPLMSALSLHPRIAIVTGGGRGIGRAMALGLAEAGVRVIVSAARERDEIEAVADEAERRFGERRIIGEVADVTRENDCARLVADALEKFGRLDILVNNAGRGMKYVSETFITEPTRFWEVAPATWRMVIDTNVVGPFLMARAAAPHMIAAGWGRIVNISMNHETMRRRASRPMGRRRLRSNPRQSSGPRTSRGPA
jgi:hypothetical protein